MDSSNRRNDAENLTLLNNVETFIKYLQFYWPHIYINIIKEGITTYK